MTHRSDKIQCQHSLFTIRSVFCGCLCILPSTWMSLQLHLFCCIIERSFLHDFYGLWANQSIVKQFYRHKVSFASKADWNAISVIYSTPLLPIFRYQLKFANRLSSLVRALGVRHQSTRQSFALQQSKIHVRRVYWKRLNSK